MPYDISKLEGIKFTGWTVRCTELQPRLDQSRRIQLRCTQSDCAEFLAAPLLLFAQLLERKLTQCCSQLQDRSLPASSLAARPSAPQVINAEASVG